MVIPIQRKVLTRTQAQGLGKSLARRLRDEQIPLKEVRLFGSYVNGTAHRDSDVDLAVIIPSGMRREDQKKLKNISWIAKQVHVKLEPHIISTTDLKNPWLTLPAEVKKKSIRIDE